VIFKIIAVSAVALVVGAYVEGARAGQFFVCDGGQTVEVEFGDLEKAKRTNPCIAKYFGINLKVAAKPSSVEVQQPQTADHATAFFAPDLPVRKPVRPVLRQSQSVAPMSKTLAGREVAGTDPGNFRRVRIINARPGGAKWFNHTQ